MEENIKDIQATFRNLIDAAPDSILIINSEGRIVYINEALANLADKSVNDLVGADFSDLFITPEKADNVIKGVFSEGSVLDAPLTIRSKDGKLAEVLFSGSVFKDLDANRNLIGFMVVPQHISARGKEVQSEKHKTTRSKVLVVEDVVLNQLLMKNMVREFGYDAEIANNGKIAIDKLHKDHYDIILMDLQMPEMDGYEATEYIRTKMHSKVPIIGLTANAATTDIERSKAAGMNDYVEKPIDEKLLHSKIDKFLVNDFLNIYDPYEEETEVKPARLSSLDYLKQRTKNNPEMMAEMIKTYLVETPALINKIKESVDNIDWEALASAAHSLIPSFKIMGVSKDYEAMARKIQDYATKMEGSSEINDLIHKLDGMSIQVCDELSNELKKIKQLVH